MVPRARPRPGSGGTGSLVISAISLTGILGNTLVAPALPDIARALRVDESGIGLVVAAASLPGVVIAPVIGLAADRFGRRSVVVPCLVIFGVGGLAAMLARSFPVLLVARFLQGFGGAGLVNLAVVMIGDRYDDVAARAAAIGRNGAVLTVGLAALPLVGGLLVEVGGWRAAFAPYALAFAVALGAARTLPPGRPSGGLTLGQQVRGAGRILRDRRVVAMNTAGFAGFLLIFGIALTTLPIDLDQRFGVGPALRGVVLGLPAATAMGVSLRMGRLSRRYDTWTLVLAGFAIFAASFAAAALAPAAALLAVAMAVYGVGEGLVIVTLQAYAAGLAPVGYRGLMVAVWVSAARAGQAAGPVLAGLCLDAVGSRGTYLAGSAVAVLSAGAVAGIRRSVSLTR